MVLTEIAKNPYLQFKVKEKHRNNVHRQLSQSKFLRSKVKPNFKNLRRKTAGD